MQLGRKVPNVQLGHGTMVVPSWDRSPRCRVGERTGPGTVARMSLRAFPVLHAVDVERVAGFYGRLGFEETVRLDGPDGRVGYIGLHREAAELAVTTVESPRQLAGIDPGPGPRGELFVYVAELDAAVDGLRGHAAILREPTDMPWGERLAFLTDPEGNLVTLAQAG